jgi:hypothetical protein
MKGECFGIIKGVETLGKNMLARVLLHVVEPGLPIDDPSYFVDGHRISQDMENFALILYHIDDFCAMDASSICRLSAGFGIKARLIENECRFILMRFAPNYLGLKFDLIRIVIV